MSDRLESASANPKKIAQLQGIVVGNKMMKTVVVEVQRRVLHPLYHKVVSRRTRIKAHTAEPIEIGSVVEVISTRPMSKDKSHRVLRVISKPKSIN
ncbi:MAG: 30S ribosomal protein S17 [Nitrospirae bacterium]|jgi:small subunit ribosomal protein S17|nr:30S ribosomal protein S17 [Nitrospirota bacterium]